MLSGSFTDVLAFVATAEAGSFVAAARVRGVSRSAIAKSVARLERRLGTRLFNRTTRSLSMTDEGRIYHARCVQILSDLEDAERSLTTDSAEPHGLLRLTAPAVLGRLQILPILYEYLDTWPKVRAEVSLTDRVSDIVEDGFDLAIRLRIRIGGASDQSQFVTRTLTEQKPVVCGSPAYLNRKGVPGEPDDLIGHDCIGNSLGGSPMPWRFRTDHGPVTVAPRSRLVLDAAEAIRDAALAGMGLAYLPTFLIDDDLRAGRLIPVLADFALPPVPIAAIYPSRRHLAPKVRRFIDLLARRMRAPG